MQYLYGKSHIKNIKKNHQEKYNLIFNQIIFSSNINKHSKVLVLGPRDNVIVKDFVNRGYNNVYYSDKFESLHNSGKAHENQVFDMIDYDLMKNSDSCTKYDLLIISAGYDVTHIDKEFNELLKFLKVGGSFIILFNAYIKAHSPVWSSIRSLYEKAVPSLFDGHVMSLEEQQKKLEFMISSREELTTIKKQDYNWIEEYTINEYINLIEKTECYNNMDLLKQVKISNQLHQAIDSNGGSLKKANKMTVLSCNKI